MARFPFQKTLDAFDFKFHIHRPEGDSVATGRYLESGDNVLLLGPPGVGKDLAVALGLKACAHGVRVLFTTATGLIATLGGCTPRAASTSGSRSWRSPSS